MENPARTFGRYVVERLLGEGAMGKVYLARDPVLNRQVAIKVISVDHQVDDKARREYLSRFTLEARLSARLNHQSIVPVYDAGEEQGVPWIAFQYIDGVTLDRIIAKHGALSVKWAVHIAMHIASALQQAHAISVIHRDIKPSNIIIDRHGGIARLADFGVAKVPWASLTCEGNAMGSPGYMSPEQIEGAALDERSDLFSLGVVLYEMLTGKHPFVRETVSATAYATIGGKYTPPGDLVAGIPSRLDAVVASCLASDPAGRVRSAAELIERLRACMPGGGERKSMAGLFAWLGAELLRLARRAAGAARSLPAVLTGKKSGDAAAPAPSPTETTAIMHRDPVSFGLPLRAGWRGRLGGFLLHNGSSRIRGLLSASSRSSWSLRSACSICSPSRCLVRFPTVKREDQGALAVIFSGEYSRPFLQRPAAAPFSARCLPGR